MTGGLWRVRSPDTSDLHDPGDKGISVTANVDELKSTDHYKLPDAPGSSHALKREPKQSKL